MKHQIDPTVDCVFKAILGRENNTVALIHFLNSVLKPDEGSRIKEAIVLNPYNEREFIDDKLTIVDVKAEDEKGNQYQIEIQLEIFPALKQRILYTWSSLYHSMLANGEDYPKLRKAISIWIIADSLFPGIADHYLPFAVYNLPHNLLLTDHMQIFIVQLPHWQWTGTVLDELDRWMYLLTQGKDLDVENPPEILQVKEMRPAMETMKRFSENEENYDLYENRRIAIWQANAIKEYKEELREEMQAQVQAQVQAAIEQKDSELEKERKEKERLVNLLKQLGVDPSQ